MPTNNRNLGQLMLGLSAINLILVAISVWNQSFLLSVVFFVTTFAWLFLARYFFTRV